ncbi:MAG: hypothetical protein ACYDEY_07620 [Acidimicrobiales bacterium]
MDHDLAAVGADGDHDLKEARRPIRPQIEGLVGVVTVVADVQGMFDGVEDVSVLEAALGLVTAGGRGELHTRESYHETTGGVVVGEGH